MIRPLTLMLAFALAAGAQESQTFKVKLVSPLDTKVNKAGDKITAEVLSPDDHKGSFVNGKIRESKGGGKVKATSVLSFTFDTLIKDGQETPIQAKIESIANAQGKEDVDEEGRVIKKTNNVPAVAKGVAEGAGVGGLLRGRTGAAAGAAAGTVASLVIVHLAVEGAHVKLDPGAELTLAVEVGKKD